LKSSKLPMEYLVHILPRAERDLADVYEEINAQHSTAAREWYVGLTAAILTLTRRPYRCPETPEETGIRHLLYGHKYHIYRVIYRVIEEEQRVDILHIRHGARQRFEGSNID
jgi:toxin ParE1/3/4